MISRDIADSLSAALSAVETAVSDVQAIGGLPLFKTKVNHVFCGLKRHPCIFSAVFLEVEGCNVQHLK